MARHFKKLNKAWRDGINSEIHDVDGDERPDEAAAFREVEAAHFLECKITKEPTQKDLDEIGFSYCDFLEGWEAALKRSGIKPKPGELCKTCGAAKECSIGRDAAEFCGGFIQKTS
jgi:hypothetical protein